MRDGAGTPSPQFPRRERRRRPAPASSRATAARSSVSLKAAGDSVGRAGSSSNVDESLDARRLQALRRLPRLARARSTTLIFFASRVAASASKASSSDETSRDQPRSIVRATTADARCRATRTGSAASAARDRAPARPRTTGSSSLSSESRAARRDAPPRVARRRRLQRRLRRALGERRPAAALGREVVRDRQHREHGAVHHGPQRRAMPGTARRRRPRPRCPRRKAAETRGHTAAARARLWPGTQNKPGRVGVVGHEEGVTRPEAQDLLRTAASSASTSSRALEGLEAEPAAPGRDDDGEHGCTFAVRELCARTGRAANRFFRVATLLSRVAFFGRVTNGAAPSGSSTAAPLARFTSGSLHTSARRAKTSFLKRAKLACCKDTRANKRASKPRAARDSGLGR